MAGRQLFDPRKQSTPARTGGGPRTRPLPPDLLAEASRRLGIIAAIGVVLWIAAPALAQVAFRSMGITEGPRYMWSLAWLNVAIGLAMFFFTRRPGIEPRLILNLSLVYLVLTAFAIGLIWHVRQLPLQPTITWSGILVLLFAAIIPNPPVRTLIAGLLAASMMPLGMLIARAEGVWEFPHATDALLMHYPDFLAVGLSVVVSRVVTGLRQQVARAREMGSYELGELIGEGGMGQVYRATHRMLARPAAIKLIRPEMLGGDDGAQAELAIKRFKREAFVAANLRSPHTVELYDFGVADDGTLYFVMELLEGMTLEELVRRTGPVPVGRAIYVVRQVCESLEEAHRAGLVHRDIKPANIHLGKLGLRYDYAKVLDFGLVKPAKQDDDRSLATAAGLTPGTPAFMAPEMAMGEEIDGRADLYALGCVLYYLLTGRVVFEGDNVLQVMAKHLNAEPVPPSKRTDEKIPKALDRLVLALLAKKPADRPPTAAALADALEEIDADRWHQHDAAEWWRRQR
jgi:serine/threonine-protein kinase